ncbi:hypothetical protein E5161_07120 [Cohnella pontilimi]|uniref:Uncharacterized protein n=1 Tax=Cohnella pontilimi TaxID=2564100 RepID=A0A4U0FD04_9BACL|nr:hypothetical protein [Cohnella pontilimi]TJY42617.1 hypothetical protein E5161_07120 [Cohnella pontilimi]
MADLVYRLIMIPLVLIISSNILLYPWKYLKWAMALVILLSLIAMHGLEERLGIMKTPHWNMLQSVVMFSGYILFSRIMTWFILRVDRKEVQAP